MERDGLDGRCGVDGSGSDEHAAIHDEQVFDVVRLSRSGDDALAGVVSHAGGAHEVPAPSAQQGNGLDGVGACGLEHLGGVGDAVVEHLPAVVG